jgi:hypothetical protein
MSAAFQRFAGISAVLVGVGGLIYGLLFGAIVYDAGRGVQLAWLTIGLVGPVLATPVIVALYYRLRDTDRGFALLALLLGLGATFGQLENAALFLGKELVPELGGGQPDPAGAFRFGVLGLSLFVFGWLIVRGGALPRGLGYLGQIGGVLLVLVYLGRVTGVIDPATEFTVIPPVLYGVVIHPIFYVWLGRLLRREAETV